jgi:RNA polymerase subunit RPABC4/transcription elongation factor Spt4
LATATIKCEVCQALLDEEDLFCPNCGTEAPRSQQVATAAVAATREATHAFTCQGCGASMSYDASAQALRCPFCGSAQLTAQHDHNVVAPQWIVPFQISKDQAESALREWLGRGFWRPGDLSERSSVDKIQAVYVPYWVFQAHTHTYWTADSNHTPPGARASWYPLSGEHRGQPGALIGASRTLSASETQQLCPFDLSVALPPDQVNLTNFTDELFSVPKKYARSQAIQTIEDIEARDCQAKYVPGSARNVHVNVRVEGLTGQPVLLPVWVMAYRYQEKVYRFLLNGQTGLAIGDAPTSWRKIAVAVGLAALIAIAIAIAAGR